MLMRLRKEDLMSAKFEAMVLWREERVLDERVGMEMVMEWLESCFCAL